MGRDLRAKLIATGVLGLLVLILPGSVRAAVPCMCPPQDGLGFGLGVSDTSTDPIFCSYPAVAGEDPNDFFCTYDRSTGTLVTDNDAGLCTASAVDCPVPPPCGDNVADPGQACDGSDLHGASCPDLGFVGGTLSCTGECTFDTSACNFGSCGDGVAAGGEACDGSDLNGASCTSAGFDAGTLSCTSQCTFDVSACTTGICGDNVANPGEACDGSDLRGGSCVDFGFDGGALACSQCTLDVSGCHKCGDNVAGAGEACDGSDLKGGTCTSLGFASGTLACDQQCALDTSACIPGGICGDGVVNAAGEQCDDGSGNNGSEGSCCSSSCQAQNCSVGVAKDSFVRTNHPDSNEGANTLLAVKNNGRDRSVVAFDLSSADTADVSKATLVLTIRRNLRAWGPLGRSIEAHALNQDFSEGNGKIVRQSSPTRGSGPGVTSACSTDSDVSNILTDCSGAAAWNGGDFAAAATDSATITNTTTGEVSFDVTADVKGGKGGWLLKTKKDRRSGGLLFYSREGAAAASDPSLAPRLLLEY